MFFLGFSDEHPVVMFSLQKNICNTKRVWVKKPSRVKPGLYNNEKQRFSPPKTWFLDTKNWVFDG